jgi:hypothetical protein
VFMNVEVWKCHALNKFTTLTPLSLLASCRQLLPIIGLKMSSLPTFALKSASKISNGT